MVRTMCTYTNTFTWFEACAVKEIDVSNDPGLTSPCE